MRLIATVLVALTFVSHMSSASTSYGSLFKSYIADRYWRSTFSWGINDGGSPDLSPVTCSSLRCVVTVGLRSGVQPVWPGTCDSGGVCVGEAVTLPQNNGSWVTVANGTSWEDAYRAFVIKYGNSGVVDMPVLHQNSVPPPGHPTWGTLCVGFISLPYSARPQLAQLAPSTTCGLVNRPDLQCTINVTAFVDLGVTNTGRQKLLSDAARLSISCTDHATVTAALTREHSIGGVPLHMEIGGKQITTTKQVIYRGSSTTLPVSISATGDFKTAGEFTESVPIIVYYY